MKLMIGTLMPLRIVGEGAPNWPQFDHHYPLDDDHCFILHKVKGHKILVEIKRGRQRVQHGLVHANLSFTDGRMANGELRHTVLEIELDPNQPINPVGEVVETLLQAGLKRWQISQMSQPSVFTHHSSSYVGPHMQSDVPVSTTNLPSDDVRFELANPTWALLDCDQEISHIYLWPGAERCIQDIQAAMDRVRSGELKPTT